MSILKKNLKAIRNKGISNVELILYKEFKSDLLNKIQVNSLLVVLDDSSRYLATQELLKLNKLPDILIFDNSDWSPRHLSLISEKYFIVNFMDFPRRSSIKKANMY